MTRSNLVFMTGLNTPHDAAPKCTASALCAVFSLPFGQLSSCLASQRRSNSAQARAYRFSNDAKTTCP